VAVAITSVGIVTGNVGLAVGSGGSDVTFVGNGSVVGTVGKDDGTATVETVGSGASRVVGDDGTTLVVV
jgi:hypothetical protein